MSNPLVEHLKEGADASVGGPWARLRRLVSRDFWRRTHLRIRQRPVMRICLGLLVAFVCGVGLGVGVAAMITPEPAAYSVVSNSTRNAQKQSSVEPVIAVRVRKEEPAPKKLPSLIDIDPITENGTEPVAQLPAEPDEKTAPVAPAAAREATPVEPKSAAAETAPGTASGAGNVPPAQPHVQVPIGAVASVNARPASAEQVSGPPVDTDTPVAAAADAAQPGTPVQPSASDGPAADALASTASQAVGVDVVQAVETPVSPAPAARNADSETPEAQTPPASPGVSFAGARSVEEAAQGRAVPRAQVALVPTELRANAATPPEGSTSDVGADAEANSEADTHTHGHAVAPGVTDGDTQLPAENADQGDVQDLQPPPHPPAKNLQLAALPMPRADTWIRNAVAVPDKPRDAMIAVIIDDMGIDQKRSKAVIDLPGPLTLSFIPYGYNLDTLVAASRAAGHEIMLHQPMEAMDPEADPGPNALRTTVSLEENRRRLLWSFSRLSGIVGLNNHMGSRFTTWTEGMEMVMEEVQDRGLLFVDSFTNNESVGYRLARDHKLPSASRDVFIDHDITADAIQKSLLELEKVARRKGFAVGIAHPHDLTREALKTWIIDARERGFDFVPISHIVRRGWKAG